MNRGRILLALILVIPIVCLGFMVFPYWHAANNVRQVDVEHGLFSPRMMNEYGSRVIRSEQELNRTLDALKAAIKQHTQDKFDEAVWVSRCERVGESIRAGKPNYAKESVILILTSGSSSSTDVALSRPHLWQGRLTCNVWKHTPSQVLADHVHRTFVLIVQNDAVAEVAIWERGKQKELLDMERRDGQ
jgi:hypothetical protein